MSNFKEKMFRMEQWMMAVTFAEAGERETALEMLNEKPTKESRKRVQKRVDKREDRRPVLRA